ncbi:hypothetical protein P22_1629 [Propionispora sp. 2/2-37]|uniref:sigma 54-interacting transcriptional regulator n=1 Tax=Propionispora sp. 2/2-37 TaxID=1677858 RepID=UPI0006BB557B|nr:sigma-54-dependent transcriptional regulator [Propionispora sp. 2/2-37]CUH95558.1 hypothetical protein P22_1629 [Propionispora sp. 2/2-37]
MKRIEQVFQFVQAECEIQYNKKRQVSGVTTEEVARNLAIQRSNASCDLNSLVKLGRLEKVEGKPVLYKTAEAGILYPETATSLSVLDQIIGAEQSLKTPLQQAKAAVMYPPFGLHILLLGETGVGKSMFAEAVFRYAQDIKRLEPNAPFVTFNCADYAHNPQLLLAQLFGVKKGSYTGAERDTAGIVEKANRGILFLDEVHRLPPEGQEMLFYLIDRGFYRSLGEVAEEKKVKVLIICATTESTDSTLLRTFTRRIPMIIKLPSIKERTLEERWELVKSFFKNEANCLKVPISVSQNSLKAFLLYDCPNNIGQLKSDIKLSCARAFLEYVSNKEGILKVCSEDLPEYIRSGFVHYKDYREEIAKIGLNGNIIFSASQEADLSVKKGEVESIYDTLEQKFKTLKAKGLSEADIQLVMSLDIDAHIRQYMANFRKDNLEELYKIVDRNIVKVTQDFLQYVMEQTGKKLEEKVLFGMSIHIAKAIERIKDGKTIRNPHINEIQETYHQEFLLAQYFGALLKREFAVDIPSDEIGFITMFLVLDDYMKESAAGRVGIIVAMHGNSTATSMVDVVNRLLGEKHAIGYDIPLEQKTEVALDEISRLVREHNEGQGILLLVDMGSLVMFGDMIYECTGIPIKTIEMVSTPMVLEAARKALMMTSLEEVYHAVTNLSPYLGRLYWSNLDFNNQLKDNVIVTACITGKGTAIKLKNMVEKSLAVYGKQMDILPIEISNMEDYKRKLDKIKREKNIIAVVSSIKPQESNVPYLSMKELIEGRLDKILPEIHPLDTKEVFEKIQFMADIINENLRIDGDAFMRMFKLFYHQLSDNGLLMQEDTAIGLVLHLACIIERIIQGETLTVCDRCETAEMEGYEKSYALIEKALEPLEKSFSVTLPENEIYNIIKLIHFI